MPGPLAVQGPARRDRRRVAILATVVLVGVGGFALQSPQRQPAPKAAGAGQLELPDARRQPALHADVARRAEVKQRFDAAVVMLHMRQYEHAVAGLHRVLELSPQMPEAHVNMGYALLGLGRHRAARDFFEGATALRPEQANAYYGLALAHEATGDLTLARGAMRSYLHLARDENPEHLRKARAALWEWDARPR